MGRPLTDYPAWLESLKPAKFYTHHEWAHSVKSETPAVLIRHDVDDGLTQYNDIDQVVKMAAIEADAGVVSTWAILHTARYCWKGGEYGGERNDGLLGLFATLEQLGHEIILHNNALAQGIRLGRPWREILEADLSWLRQSGCKVRSSAAHGDALCRPDNFVNWQIFPEIQRDVKTIQGQAIPGPPMSHYGFEYEAAYEFGAERWYSDSGGTQRWREGKPGSLKYPTKAVTYALAHPQWWHL